MISASISIPLTRRARVLAIGVLVLAYGVAAGAQVPPLESWDDVDKAREYAQNQIEMVDPSIDPDGIMLQTYNQVLTQLQQAQTAHQAVTDLQTRSEQAPADVAAFEAEAATSQAAEPPDLDEDAPLPELERRLGQARDELAEVTTALEARRARREERNARRAQLPDALSNAHEALEAARAALNAPPAEGTPPALAEAQRLLAQATVLARDWEIRALRAELDAFDILGERLDAEIEAHAQEAARLERDVAVIQKAVDRGRMAEADKAAAEARSAVLQAANAGPAVRDAVQQLAEDNRRLAALRTSDDGPLALTAQADQQRGEVESLRTRISGDYESLKRKQESGEVGGSFGVLLHRYRASLPDDGAYRHRIREVQAAIVQADLMQLELEESYRSLRNLDAATQRMLADAAPSLEADRRRQLERLVRDLLETKRDYVTTLRRDYGTYLDTLAALNVQQVELVKVLESFRTFIDENVLWVRSGDLLERGDISRATDALGWFLDSREWRNVGLALWAEAGALPFLHGMVLIVLLALIGFHPRLRKHLNAMGERAAKPNCITFRPTLMALVDTVVMTVPLPALLAFLSWSGARSLHATDFTRAVAQGVETAALLLLGFQAARRIARPLGLAEAHFGWPRPQLRSLRFEVLWVGAVVTVAFGIVYALEAQESELWKHSLGRVAFLVAMAAVVLFVHLNLRAKGPIVSFIEIRLLQRRIHMRPLWHVLFMAAPLALAIIAILGYYYTALRMASRLFVSVGLAFAALLSAALVLRWLLVVRRRIALEQAKKRRAAAKEREGDGTVPVETEEDLVDISKIGEQTQRLVRGFATAGFLVSLWFVWASELPALGRLNSLPLWAGASMTVGNLVMGLLIAVLTLVAVRNVPGFMEIALLQRLSLGGGERYAIRTLVAYALGALGSILSLQTLGVPWGKLQWLVAAMGVGLGFGLQEIFANFVSGLIILFERPIRVGDIVTVGDISGTVTRIRIRATSIQSFDRKELIVPNKEFVSSKLVNWTLTDATLRVVIPVGVAYGSDTMEVVALLQRVAKEHPLVLSDPAPQVAFVGFGATSLNFELRVFVPNPEAYAQTQHDLFMSIERAFRDPSVDVAFPQRDVDIRSIKSVMRPPEKPAAVEAPVVKERERR